MGKGGRIDGAHVPAWLGPDECLIRLSADDRGLRCCRSTHPTPTSDCGRPGATIKPPAGT